MRYVNYVIALVLGAVIVTFALSNREPVAVGMWPFSSELVMPLFLPVLLAAGIAFLIGAVAAGVAALPQRRRARRAIAEAEAMRIERDRAREELAEARGAREAQAATPSTAVALPSGPAVGAADRLAG